MLHVVDSVGIATGWEEATRWCWDNGQQIKTQYDRAGDPPSRDCTMIIQCSGSAEPRLHKFFPGGIADLEKYRAEVVYGVHDHWVDVNDPAKWHYTYHGRIAGQLYDVIKKLREAPYGRRAILNTWVPAIDSNSTEPPCLQYMMFRVGATGMLDMNVHIRSNDALKAAFMNMYAFTELQAWIAEAVGVPVGLYTHIADSFHIYGKDFGDVVTLLNLATKEPAARFWQSDEAIVREWAIEGIDTLLAETGYPTLCRQQLEGRRAVLQGD